MSRALEKQLRGRFGDIVAIVVLLVLGLATMLGILSQQRAALPAFVPVLGQEFFTLEAEFETGQSVMPGQGQAITIAGVQVGKIDNVHLEEGKAIVSMNVEPQYAELINEDAELLLRPKTNLNDMVIDVEPGDSPEPIEEGALVPVANTAPNVNPEEFINALDGDTQHYLQMLLSAGAEGLGGDGGRQLGNFFRRFYPWVRDVAKLNTAVAQRRESLARVIHNFGRLTEELGRNEQIVTRWVGSSSEVLGAFADEAEQIRAALRELPSTLQQTDDALSSADEFSTAMGPALAKLIPQAEALGPAMRATGTMFRETTPALREQVRPFTRQIQPLLEATNRGSDELAQTVKGFGDAVGELNHLFNLLAYNPGPQDPGYLFYLPWLNHTINANYMTYDAAGPMRRGSIFYTCQTRYLAEGLTGGQPYLRTLLQVTNAPTAEEMADQLIARDIDPFRNDANPLRRYCQVEGEGEGEGEADGDGAADGEDSDE